MIRRGNYVPMLSKDNGVYYWYCTYSRVRWRMTVPEAILLKCWLVVR